MSDPMPLPRASRRVYGLDVMRAIAVLAVLISHGRFWLTDLHPGFERLRVFGYLGIELFFVLSGFLIGGILIRQTSRDASAKGLVGFWLRRWFRTLPNYYLFLAVHVAILWVLLDGFRPSPQYLVFLQNFAALNLPFFAESWSLAVEEWFYLGFPLLFWLLHRCMSQQTAIWVSCALFVVGFSGARVWAATYTELEFNAVRKIVVFRLDSVMFGVFAAYLKRYHETWWGGLARVAKPVGLVLLLITVGIYVVLERPWLDQGLFGRTVYFSLTSLGAFFLLPWLDGWRTSESRLAPWTERVSLWSYSMYLANLPVAAALGRVDWLAPRASTWPLGLAAFFVVTTVVSFLTYQFYEVKMTRLRERFAPDSESPTSRSAGSPAPRA